MATVYWGVGVGGEYSVLQSISINWSIQSPSPYTQSRLVVGGWISAGSAIAPDFGANTATIPAGTLGAGTYTLSVQGLNGSTWSTISSNSTGTITIRAPVTPGTPTITSPATNAEFYTTSTIPISWTYSGSMAHAGTDIAYRALSGGSLTTVAGLSGSDKAYSLSAALLPLGSAEQAYFELYVRTRGSDGGVSSWSSPVPISIVAARPSKPVPTAPLDNASTYPISPLTVTIPYTSVGGALAASVKFEYRYNASESWRALTYSVTSGSTLTITIPASTFTIGDVQWRVTVTDTQGKSSDPSDMRTLHVVSSAPLVPTLTRPTAGSTLYNHEPVTYGWTYNSNVSLKQFSFRLQWRVLGAGSWTTIEQVSESGQWIIDHGALDAVIEWRVQTSNQYNEWSSYSAASSYTLATPYPEVTPMQPTGGYIDPAKPQLFEWDYSSPISAPMAAAELQYRLEDDAGWTDAPVGNETSLTIVANTLPVGRLLWRVRMRDSAGNWSAWTTETLVHTRDVAPDAPTPLAPMDVYIAVSDSIHFAWRHNSPIATPQGGADIAYSVDGGAEQLIHMDGSTQSYDTMPFMIVPGSVIWRVRTYNTAYEPGEWSVESAFSVTGAPVTPSILSSSANGSRPGFAWVASGQIVYQVELRDEWGNLLDLTEQPAMDDRGAYIAPMYVPNGRYTLRVRAKNQYNFWSDWAQVAIIVAVPYRLGPAISASPRDYAIRIDLDGLDWEIVDHVLIYRGGVPVLRGNDNVFLDYGAPVNITLRYYARAVYMDGSFADSDTVAAMLQITGSVIAPADDLGQILHIRINRDGAPGISSTASRDATLIPVAGQELPVVEYGEQLRRQFSVDLAVRGSEDADALNAIYAQTRPVLLRDVFGRHAWCRVASASDQSALTRIRAKARSLSLVLEQVAHDERVSID